MPYLYAVYLSQLKITQFKNYESQALVFSPRMNCLTGLNGMGKTNVLDAIHYLCLCKNHSGLPDKNLIRHGEAFFRLDATFFNEQQASERVVVKYQSGQRKEFERNGAPVLKLTEYVGQYPVVMIAPDDVTLVQDGSEERRRFLDATISQISPEYLQNLLIYNQLLKQRNALLKTFGAERRFDATLLESIDRQMGAPAAVIHQHRQQLAADMAPVFADCYAEISGSREQVSIRYESDLDAMDLPTLFKENIEKDRALERSSAGPHRDELVLGMDGMLVRKFASQGQLKSFLLALRLAQYELLQKAKNVQPLLLLDDIFDKLDEQRVRQLIGLLLNRSFGQIFITDTQRARIESVISSFPGPYSLFEVHAGVIVPVSGRDANNTEAA